MMNQSEIMITECLPERVIGLDLGSRTAKGILITRKHIYKSIFPTGISPKETAHKLAEHLCSQAEMDMSSLRFAAITGYGCATAKLKDIPSNIKTEIACHAKGAWLLCPEAQSVLDMGGQDSKAIELGKNGEPVDFVLNDRCAAGTGRFLEKAAVLLGMSMDAFSAAAASSEKEAEISSQCVVFAESEIISLRASKESAASIAFGVCNASAKRAKALMNRIEFSSPVYFSGGVASNQGMRKAVANVLNCKLCSSSVLEPVYTGALGAAFFAGECV